MEEKIKILHIDDEYQLLELTEIFLKQINNKIEIKKTSDWKKGLLLASTENFDVVICDYQLSNDYTGLDLFADLKRKNKSIPFIILTGRSREEIVIKSINMGIDYYLQKSENPQVLYAELNHYIEAAVLKTKQERIVEETAEKIKSIISSMDDLIFVHDINGIYLEYYQPKKEKLLVPPETFIGKHYSEILPQKIVSELDHAFEVVKKTLLVSEIDYKLKIGNDELWFSAKISPIIISGSLTGFISVVRDITERQIQKHELEKQNKNFELLLNIFAHDLKNYHATSLLSIDMIKTLIKDNNLKKELIEPYFLSLESGITSSDDLINNLYVLIHQQHMKHSSAQLHEINVIESVNQSVKVIENIYNNVDLKIKKIFKNEKFTILADSLFNQILINLLSNAVKNDPHEFIIIDIIVELNSESIFISIHDRGVGIPLKDRTSLFSIKKFQKNVKREGMGLYIVKSLINRYNGTITIENRIAGDYSKGTIFKLQIKSRQ